MTAVCQLGFLKNDFLQPLRSREPLCISIQNFIEIGPTVAEIYSNISFFKMAAVCHFEFVGNCWDYSQLILGGLSLIRIWLESLQSF